MKTAVIYYSLEGNTGYTAKMIAERLNADVFPLVPKKAYPTGLVTKYVFGGRSAVMSETPELEKLDLDLSGYDTVILGTPVWASTLAPPLRTFLQENTLNGKRVALFACSAAGSADKCFANLEQLMPQSRFIGRLWLIDPLKRKKEANTVKIDDFCKSIAAE